MSFFEISLDIPDEELTKLLNVILKEVANNIVNKININKNFILEDLKLYLTEVFWSNPVVISLLSDDKDGLRSQMGLAKETAVNVLTQILNVLIDSIQIRSYGQSIGDHQVITTELRIILQDYEKLLAIPGANYKSKTYDIEWLKWILYNAGEFVLVTKHNIKTNMSAIQAKRSRSGLSIMTPSKNAVWRVPDWVFTTGHKNFIEQILDTIDDKVATFIEKQI